MTNSRVTINTARVAVDQGYYWQPMSTCPTHTKVQLLNPGRVAVYGKWNGRDDFWLGWAPLPKYRETAELLDSIMTGGSNG